MNIKSIISELQNILPQENFKIQPNAALSEIKAFESKYNVNTQTFLENGLNGIINEEDSHKWLLACETALLFSED